MAPAVKHMIIAATAAFATSSAMAFTPQTRAKTWVNSRHTRTAYSRDDVSSPDEADLYHTPSTVPPETTAHMAAEAVDTYSWSEEEALDAYSREFEDFYMARKAAIEEAYPLTEYYKQEERRKDMAESTSFINKKSVRAWLRTAEAINGRIAMWACAVVAFRELMDPSMRMSMMMAEAGIPDPTTLFS